MVLLLLSQSECVELLTHLQEIEERVGLTATLGNFMATIKKTEVQPLKQLAQAPSPLRMPTDKEVQEAKKAHAADIRLEYRAQKNIPPAYFPSRHFFQLPSDFPVGKQFPVLGGLVAEKLEDGSMQFHSTIRWVAKSDGGIKYYKI